MATVTTETGKKDVISPTKGKYYIKFIWVLDAKTKLPVRVNVERTLT